jgi:hypothetical protein
VQEKKIRVVYGEKLGATPLKNGIHTTDAVVSFVLHFVWVSINLRKQNTPDTAPPPAYSSARSPSPEETFTPNTTRPSLTANASRFDDEPKSAKSISDSKVSARTSLAGSTDNAASPSYEELKAKLAEAQATISSYAKEGGLRMRKAAQGESGNKAVDEVVNQIQAAQGVPLQIVAILCLVSFLLAYLFFWSPLLSALVLLWTRRDMLWSGRYGVQPGERGSKTRRRSIPSDCTIPIDHDDQDFSISRVYFTGPQRMVNFFTLLPLALLVIAIGGARVLGALR